MDYDNEDLKYLKSLLPERTFECGWSIDASLELIYGLIRFYKPDLVIHTGFLWGKSSLFVLEAFREYEIEHDYDIIKNYDENFYKFLSKHIPQKRLYAKLIAIDNNMFNLNIEEASKYLKLIDKNFELYLMDSNKFWNKIFKGEIVLPAYLNLFGMVDGDHTVSGCEDDLINLADLNAKVIVVDDTIWLPELDEVCKKFSKEFNYSYINHKLYSGLGVLLKNE